MGITPSSDQHRSIHPFTRVKTPLFLGTDPADIRTVPQASQLFLSLVDYVEKGNILDDTATRHACSLLERLTPDERGTIAPRQILIHLAPTPDGSCSGFTKSIVTLLTSSNEELIKSSLALQGQVVSNIDHAFRFDFIQTGFFLLLPKSFFEREIHLTTHPSLHMVKTVHALFFCSHPLHSGMICRERHILMATFQKTYIDNDSLHLLETVDLASSLLLDVVNVKTTLQKDDAAVQKRRQQILVKLHEEGFSDECELHFRCHGFDQEHHDIFVGVFLIAKFGGNARFWVERFG
ncbi:hypothetical protein BLNAU_10508 [Blattamonas nauphoetae]|uniref:Uncharacterized protein n=1 Tax=Blattamonas nauphoetae TaxID=2049346 RepID=A0ABQ9XQ20_9EUKA|nr:hypothetical protein BLNAU_10508 [Blattamonas nauphoetae]